VIVQNIGSYYLRIVSNATNTLSSVAVIFDPPQGVVNDAPTYDVMNMPPGEYTVYAALGDCDTGTGERLPGAVSPPVSFVILDRATAADDDLDGMPDLWETRFGLDSSKPEDAAQDADSDGLTNYQEMLAGTDPSDPQSNLAINLIRLSEGYLELFFPSAGGRTYRILRNSSPTSLGWTPLGNPVRGGGTGYSGFNVPTDQLRSNDFFRVVLEAE
jgi:hypothetical protein